MKTKNKIINGFASNAWCVYVVAFLALYLCVMAVDAPAIAGGSVEEFGSERELKESLDATLWREAKVNDKRFLITIIPLLSAGSSLELAGCWREDPKTGRFRNVWAVRLREIGPASLEYDSATATVSVVAVANTKLNGKVVAFVNLSAL
jgi:hypothetical protein